MSGGVLLLFLLVLIILPLIYSLAFGSWARAYGRGKGFNPAACFWAGFFFGILTIAVLALMKRRVPQESQQSALPGPPADRSWAPWLVAVVAGVVFAAGIIVYYAPLKNARADNSVGQFSGRESAAMNAAAVETANLLTYHRATFAADYSRAVNGATGALQKDIAGKKAETLSTLTKGKFDLTARVTHQALVGPSGKSNILVLISINGYKSTAPDVPTQQNLQVTMTKVGSKWLASNVQTPGVS